MGTSKGLEYSSKFQQKCKINYKNYYVLKCDIHHFFASIDHDRLKHKVERRIKDKDALKIVFDIIDSNTEGLFIGSMTSQILAIFYLNDLDHFIKEKLKIKYYVRYQDDFLLYHPSKKYLKYCLEEIKKFLELEKLELNNKTRIYKGTNNFIFLGRNSRGDYTRYRNVKRKLKSKLYLYRNNKISLQSFASSVICYKGLCKKNAHLLSFIKPS
jgi:retron-type reverse transcriptase